MEWIDILSFYLPTIRQRVMGWDADCGGGEWEEFRRLTEENRKTMHPVEAEVYAYMGLRHRRHMTQQQLTLLSGPGIEALREQQEAAREAQIDAELDRVSREAERYLLERSSIQFSDGVPL